MAESLVAQPERQTAAQDPSADTLPASAALDVRFERVDQLRGVAALGVVVCHMSVSAQRADPLAGESWSLLALVLGFGYIGVPLFFVISGFCIHLPQARRVAQDGAYVSPRWSSFFARRFWRLYPPYLAALVLAGLVLGPFHGWPPVPWSTLALESLLLHTFHASTFDGLNPPAWTLALEAQFYLTYPIVFWMIARGGARTTLCAVLAVTLGYRLLLAFQPLPDGFGGPAWEFFLARWFEWTLGTTVAEWSAGRLRLPRALFHPSLAALALAIAIFIEWHIWHGGLYIVKELVYGIAFALVLGAVLQRPTTSSPPSTTGRYLTRLGVCSYSVYLLHRPLQLALEPLAREAARWSLANDFAIPASLLVLLASTPIVLAASSAFYFLCEAPCIERARRSGRAIE
jgi:peptidoglycan/LPS O-acetylase OafA/YrhL